MTFDFKWYNKVYYAPCLAEGGEWRGRAGGIVFWDYLIILTYKVWKMEATLNETLVSLAYFNCIGTRCTEHTSFRNMEATFKGNSGYYRLQRLKLLLFLLNTLP